MASKKRSVPGFAQRLAGLVRAHGGTSRVARRIGVQPRRLERWMHAGSEPALAHLVRISAVLGVSVDELLHAPGHEWARVARALADAIEADAGRRSRGVAP